MMKNLQGGEVLLIFDPICMSLIKRLNKREMSEIYPRRGLLMYNTEDMEKHAK